MASQNKFGLSRNVPAKIRRQVRENSKFGCVICRSGFYQYEHIDPVFECAEKHDPDAICCLCGSCHDAVTRGRLSKQAIKAAYEKIKFADIKDVDQPVGPLDFHNGSAELKLGKLLYSPVVQSVLRYHGQDLIRVVPGQDGMPGSISADFTNSDGDVILQLVNNEWLGNLESWDIEVIGQKITVRSGSGVIALQIRLDPPGRVVIERLDMRIHDGHVIATESTYAIGRYISETEAMWLHCEIVINRAESTGVAMEFTDPEKLEERDSLFMNTSQGLANQDRSFVMNTHSGVFLKPFGLAIASFCGAFNMGPTACGIRKVTDVRRVAITKPESLAQFIGTGQVT
ncbi:MAG: hypothetical protein U1D25_06260 [Hydrogenophaga sp.]|uniref:HNH endonuclease n=1 Tax=Hydrogenophaga sp. TaxID=1904254 RepID=UPI002767D84C|nr:hypothetical protein [Hydrogenophaga sp.]MDP2417590.1 hypothetical protein [Hydrogenophaga sp.]MDZ4187696.1 hypothetical protein [Hydrogenophaga sp.]